MSENSANNKRIAKNTLMLYARMLLLMGVSLYTSRIVLSSLGVEDFGIYNVVGGVVAMFTMISGALSSAIGRFITFSLGKNDQERLNIVFSTSVIIQLLIGVIIVLLVESIGVWFLCNKMVIPIDRLTAAQWVLQISLVNLVINLICVPYNAVIIAHEHMGAFAYISILEAFGKLLVAFCITLTPIDTLVFFALLSAVISLVIRFIYTSYCHRHFEESKFRWVFDKSLFKEMFGFAWWNFLGTSAAMLRDQGCNILLNLFFGPSVNAARGVSSQVNNAICQFSGNFMTALNPQITKSYASGNNDYMMTLIYQGARLSFYLLLLLSLPVFINTNYILSLWLDVVPKHTVLFVKLTLVFSMIESLSNPLITAMLAYGKIKNYAKAIAIFSFLNIPISYVLLKSGLGPEVVIVVAIFVSICCLATRLYMLRGMIGLSAIAYFKRVVLNVVTVSALSVILPYVYYSNCSENFVSFIVCSLICVFTSLVSIYFVGCTASERTMVVTYIQRIIKNSRG